MENLDSKKEAREAFAAKVMKAVEDGKPDEMVAALVAFANETREAIKEEARSLANVTDAAVLDARGVRQLTAQEKTYYQKMAEAMKTSNPRQALTDLDVVFPQTTIDRVFDDLIESHPLLGVIKFQSASIVTKFVTSKSGGFAVWGELTEEIKGELRAEFAEVDLTLGKLTAWIPVAKDMLDLGPVWIDKYVRLILAEAIAVGLEAGIVDGDGKNKPVGMTRSLSGAVDGVYPRKTAVTVTSLDPKTIGSILDAVSKTPNGHRRNVPSLLMVVSPSDYFTKVYPATTIRATNGTYNKDVLPYPINVVISAAIPEGFAVFGLADKYFMGIGSGKDGKIEYSDDYKFMEDQRIYAIKFHGNGRPLDENAFVYADISGIVPTTLQVEVVPAEEEA